MYNFIVSNKTEIADSGDYFMVSSQLWLKTLVAVETTCDRVFAYCSAK